MDLSYTDTLASFAADLALSPQVRQQAQKILKPIFTPQIQAKLKVEKKIWVACAIYIAVQDIGYPYTQDSQRQPEVTVSQLLEKADVHIMEFFNVMCFVKRNYPLTNNSKQSLISLERKYLIISALFDKFTNIVNEVFCGDAECSTSNGQTSDLQSLILNQKSLCWMLFLVAKAEVLWHRQELLATFHLLLCCMSEVIKATPTFLLIPPFDGVVGTGESSFSVLLLLSNHVNTNFDEVKIAYNCWLHVAGELIPNGKLPLLADLRTRYKDLYLKNGDIDESLLLERNEHLIPQSSDSSCAKSPPGNSIKRVLDTVHALHIILKSAADELSPSLKRCFQKCSKDPTSFIENLIMSFKDTFTTALVESHEGGNKQLAHQRYKLAVRYYYLMLDAMLKMEGERLSTSEFTALLHNEHFHQSLLACCTEVILMSCGSVGSVSFTPVHQGGSARAQGVLFPWILKTFNLKAFHFFKVIESFIKAAPSITQQIIKHLNQIEEKILESLAWTSDSPIFRSLLPSNCTNTFKPKGNPPKVNESMWSSKEPTGNSQSSPPLSHAVNIFLNKASRLAFRRLGYLCSLMQISNEMQSAIWVCIEHILYMKPSLLKDRHLDQIIMCSMYAVCRVLEQDVQFKAIIKSYIQLPFATDSVYKQVLTEGSKREFIVVFYNHIFTNEVKDYLYKQFSKPKESSSLDAVQSPLILSPAYYSLPGNKKIFVSPLRKSPLKNPNEVNHGLSQSYNFGIPNQGSSKLRTINETIKILQPGTEGNGSPRGKKRLQFNSDSELDSKGIDEDITCDSSAKRFKTEKPLTKKNMDEEDC